MSTTPSPVPAESTAGIELASATEIVTAPEVEALGPQVEGEAWHARGYCHKHESAGLMDCEGVRAKSMRCGEGVQVRVIRLLERAPLLDILMKIWFVIPEGRRLGRKCSN
jgi:uncharacterized ParB-like nuclease family protein